MTQQKPNWKSTKLGLTLITCGLLTLAFLLLVALIFIRYDDTSALLDWTVRLFDSYAFALLAGTGAYSAANVVSTRRAQPPATPPAPAPEPSKEGEQ